VERRIERALVHLEHAFRDLSNPLAEPPAVQRVERRGLEDQEI
jgi:hypothetical protein